MSIVKFAVPCLLLAAVAGPAAAAEPLPDAIAAPGETVVLGVHAEGAQVYDCKAAADGKLAWAFREPVATLLAEGKTVGRHYAGPNWELADGSAVAGKAIGNAPGATARRYPLAQAGGRLPPRQRHPDASHHGPAHQHPRRQARGFLRQGRRVQKRTLLGRLHFPEEGLTAQRSVSSRSACANSAAARSPVSSSRAFAVWWTWAASVGMRSISA
ncbi:hypothetical protein ACVWZR_007273 [Bradyrhizobium sp. i1.3.1]